MAITVTPNLTDVSLCEATTGWTGGQGYVAIDATSKVQGTYSLSDWVDLTTGAVAKYDLVTGTDMSNGEHIYAWLYCTGAIDTQANGGYRLYAEDTSGNSATWYVGGVDTHPAGGWNIFTVSLDATPDASVGTLITSAIRYIGVQFKVLSDAPIKGQTRFNNVFWDAVRYGKGLTVTSASTDNISIADIYAVDDGSTLKYGVVTRPAGINAYVVNGRIILGDTGTGTIDFLSSGEVVFFPSNDLVSADFHGIEVLGNATGTTDIDINGSTYVSSGVSYALDFDGANLDTISLVGNSFTNSKAPTFSSSQTITNNTFDGCGLITPSTSTFTSNVVKNSSQTTSYALFVEKVNSISKTTYTNNYWAFGVTPAVSGDIYTENGGIFSGNTADVYNTHATNAVTISKVNGSNPTTSATAGGVVTIQGSVSIAINVKNQSAANLLGALVYIDEDLETAGEIVNTTTDVSGNVNTSYAGAASTATVRVRLYGYKPYIGVISLATDSSTNITLITDPQQT